MAETVSRRTAGAISRLRLYMAGWRIAFACLKGSHQLRSCRPAMREIGNEARRETRRWLNNRAVNSGLPIRRRERAMLRFRDMRSLQTFAALHSSVHNHFNLERHLFPRSDFKENRDAALAQWRELAA